MPVLTTSDTKTMASTEILGSQLLRPLPSHATLTKFGIVGILCMLHFFQVGRNGKHTEHTVNNLYIICFAAIDKAHAFIFSMHVSTTPLSRSVSKNS
jgi:hypothetical protein